jgi:hypothetical protein
MKDKGKPSDTRARIFRRPESAMILIIPGLGHHTNTVLFSIGLAVPK